MKSTLENYKYLAGGNRSGGSLWAGPDHLLCVQNAGFILPFSETYKRIDYAKIQTISFAKTGRWIWLTVWLVLAILLAAGLGVGALNFFRLVAPQVHLDFLTPSMAGVMMALPMVALLIVHLALGPTCVCKIQTAVQVMRLTPLRRMRSAQRVISQLNELCQLHQGGIPLSSDALFAASATGADRDDGRGLIKPLFAGSKLLLIGLPMMILSGVLTVAGLFINHFSVFMVCAGVSVAGLVLCIAGLARGMHFTMPGALKFSLWGLVGNLIFAMVIGMIIQGYISFENVQNNIKSGHFEVQTQMSILQWMAKVNFTNYPVIAWLVAAQGSLDIVFAMIGLPSVLRPPGVPMPKPYAEPPKDLFDPPPTTDA